MGTPFRPNIGATVRISNATAPGTAVPLPGFPHGGGCTIRIYNRGAVPAFVEFGRSDVVASVPGANAGSIEIPVGATEFFTVDQTQRFVAVAVESGAPALEISTGWGGISGYGSSAPQTAGTSAASPSFSNIVNRAQLFVEAPTNMAVAANGLAGGTIRDLGGMISAYTRINVKAAVSAGGGTLYIQESNDNFATGVNTASVPLAAAGTVYGLTVPITSRYMKTLIVKDGTPGSIVLFNSSFTAA